MSQLVLYDQIGPVATLTLNRPERHNSLVPALLAELLAALEAIAGNSKVRAVVLQANGRSFSTGGDMRGFYDHRETLETYASEVVGMLNQAILALLQLPIPVIAAVNGIVTGGSMGLVLASDIVLVTPEASFTPYYSVVGFSPDGGWTALLPAILGGKRTNEIMMRNLTLTAEQVVEWGLASRVVAAEHLRQEVLEMAQQIASNKIASLRIIKRLLNMAHGDVAARLEKERTQFIQQIATNEARSGIFQFLEGRQPSAPA